MLRGKWHAKYVSSRGWLKKNKSWGNAGSGRLSIPLHRGGLSEHNRFGAKAVDARHLQVCSQWLFNKQKCPGPMANPQKKKRKKKGTCTDDPRYAWLLTGSMCNYTTSYTPQIDCPRLCPWFFPSRPDKTCDLRRLILWAHPHDKQVEFCGLMGDDCQIRESCLVRVLRDSRSSLEKDPELGR